MICGELDADTKATINTVNHSLLSGYKTTQRDREREGWGKRVKNRGRACVIYSMRVNIREADGEQEYGG